MSKTVSQVTSNALGYRRNVVLFRERQRICLFSTASKKALGTWSLPLEGYRGTFLLGRDMNPLGHFYLPARSNNE